MSYFGGKRYGKFGAKRVKRAGISYASQTEATVHDMLLAREKAGEVEDIKLQVSVRLTEAEIRWVIDYSFLDVKTKERWYCEAKGDATDQLPRWVICKQLWPFYGPGPIEIWKKKRNILYLDQTILPRSTYRDMASFPNEM